MKLAVLDLETWGPGVGYGLQPWRPESYITVLATAGEQAGMKFASADPFPRDDQLTEFLHWCYYEGLTIATWNGAFDIAWLLAKGASRELIMSVQWLDGILLWKRVDRMQKAYNKEELNKRGQDYSYGLKQAVREFIPELAGYETDVRYDFGPMTALDDPDFQNLMTYAKIDAVATGRIVEHLWAELPDAEKSAARQEAAMLPHVAEAWCRGIQVDKDAVISLAGDCAKAKQALLAKVGVPDSVISSPKQLGNLLFTEWGLDPVEFTDSGKPSTNKHSLTVLAQQDERARTILDIRNLNTRLNKFVKGPAASVPYCGDGATHPQPVIAGTYTGRMTYYSNQRLRAPSPKTGRMSWQELPTGVALHQWQRPSEVRRMMIPPEGYLLAELDFAGQEMRLMADFSGDERMIDIFVKDLNCHSMMTARLYECSYDEIEVEKHTNKLRYNLGKLANLSLQYRTSADKLREKALTDYDMVLTPDEAQHAWSQYRYAMYPDVPVYWDVAIDKARQLGFAETRGRRKINLHIDGWRAESTAINFPIQGTGADQKAFALSACHDYMQQHGIRFAWDLHDGLYFYVPDTYYAANHVNNMRYIMDNLDYEGAWGWTPRVPFPVDASLGPRWGELKEIKPNLQFLPPDEGIINTFNSAVNKSGGGTL